MGPRRAGALPTLTLALAGSGLTTFVGSGCSDDEDRRVEGRGVDMRGGNLEPSHQPGGGGRQQPERARDESVEKGGTAGNAAPSAPAAPAPQGGGGDSSSRASRTAEDRTLDASDDRDQRDLAAELRQGVGEVQGCLAERAGELPERIAIQLRAHVSTTGRVTRGYVQSAPLSRMARRCLQERLEHVRLDAPVPDAPRRIDATITLERRAASAE